MTATVNNENTNRESYHKAGRKPYSKPEITHELELETRAGTPAGIDPIDILPKQ